MGEAKTYKQLRTQLELLSARATMVGETASFTADEASKRIAPTLTICLAMINKRGEQNVADGLG